MASLEEIASAIQTVVNTGGMAGAATLVWRGGKLVNASAFGWRDVERRLPMERSSLFRIASMTKPITSMAALMLLEEQKLALNDPITRWAPEFSSMRVLRSATGPLERTEPAARPITIEDLLTHRSGLTYEFLNAGPLAEAYRQALGGMIDSVIDPNEWIAALGRLPLASQPGSRFQYGRSTDLLGLLIERIADAPLADFLKRRIFDPLDMGDTGFTVPDIKRYRRAQLYGVDASGRLIAKPMAERAETLRYVSGGQGLWSTVDDYLAFACMFLGQGSVRGARLLRPETLAMMTTNRLTEEQRTAHLMGAPLFAGHGFGLGVSVVADPDKASLMLGRGRQGAVGWPGAFGGWWQADPLDDAVKIFLTHNNVSQTELAKGLGLGAYGALMLFQSLANVHERTPDETGNRAR